MDTGDPLGFALRLFALLTSSFGCAGNLLTIICILYAKSLRNSFIVLILLHTILNVAMELLIATGTNLSPRLRVLRLQKEILPFSTAAQAVWSMQALTLFLLGIDRFLAVINPIVYDSLHRWRYALRLVGVVVAYAAVLTAGWLLIPRANNSRVFADWQSMMAILINSVLAMVTMGIFLNTLHQVNRGVPQLLSDLMLIHRGNRIFGPILAANLLLWIVSLSTCIATELVGLNETTDSANVLLCLWSLPPLVSSIIHFAPRTSEHRSILARLFVALFRRCFPQKSLSTKNAVFHVHRPSSRPLHRAPYAGHRATQPSITGLQLPPVPRRVRYLSTSTLDQFPSITISVTENSFC